MGPPAPAGRPSTRVHLQVTVCVPIPVPVPVPRDVSSVELLMNNHQGIKAEIDARNDSFTSCIELGKALLARKHYASVEVRGRGLAAGGGGATTATLSLLHLQIKEKLLQLTDKRKEMIDKWEDRWEWLRLSKPHPHPGSIQVLQVPPRSW